MTTVQNDYTRLVQTLRGIGEALAPAVEARYDAPPSGAAHGGGQVPNPTLDIVLDPRRMALSAEVDKVSIALRRATATLEPRIKALTTATRRWEGQKE